ncbi:SPOR domain-containing protein, partial [bacterium]|nr:SPOR domain-containing protein [bacterium]
VTAAPGTATAQPAHPAPPPASQPAVPAVQKYAVQVGAFTIQSNALLNKAFFEGEGFPVQLSTKKKNGTVFYLVWIGFFDSEQKARTVSETLKRKYDVQPTLVWE